jgi:hypothetical protein
MSPARKRSTYRPPRPRREIVTAVLTTAAIVAFTGIMVFVLGPHSSGSSPSTPAATVPASSASTTPPSSTATSTPAATGSTSSTTAGG